MAYNKLGWINESTRKSKLGHPLTDDMVSSMIAGRSTLFANMYDRE